MNSNVPPNAPLSEGHLPSSHYVSFQNNNNNNNINSNNNNSAMYLSTNSINNDNNNPVYQTRLTGGSSGRLKSSDRSNVSQRPSGSSDRKNILRQLPPSASALSSSLINTPIHDNHERQINEGESKKNEYSNYSNQNNKNVNTNNNNINDGHRTIYPHYHYTQQQDLPPPPRSPFLFLFWCSPTKRFCCCFSSRLAVQVLSGLTIISGVVTITSLFINSLMFFAGYSMSIRVISTIMAVYGIIAGTSGFSGAICMSAPQIHTYYIYLIVHFCLSIIRLIASSLEIDSCQGKDCDDQEVFVDISISATSVINILIDTYLLYVVWSLLQAALCTVVFCSSIVSIDSDINNNSNDLNNDIKNNSRLPFNSMRPVSPGYNVERCSQLPTPPHMSLLPYVPNPSATSTSSSSNAVVYPHDSGSMPTTNPYYRPLEYPLLGSTSSSVAPAPSLGSPVPTPFGYITPAVQNSASPDPNITENYINSNNRNIKYNSNTNSTDSTISSIGNISSSNIIHNHLINNNNNSRPSPSNPHNEGGSGGDSNININSNSQWNVGSRNCFVEGREPPSNPNYIP